MKVLLDTNVLLDVLAQRAPFYADSAEVWTLAETGQIAGFASALSLPNLYYIMRRQKGAKAACKTVGRLRDLFALVPLDQQIINQATDAAIADFEDAIQYFSALRAQCDVLITRNTGDFSGAEIAIQTPTEFLATLRFKSGGEA